MKKSWKTSLMGALMLVMTGLSIATNPAKALNQDSVQTIGGLAAGIGLIAAKDYTVSGSG